MTPNRQRHNEVLEDICADRGDVDFRVLDRVLLLAIELAREGREGRKVGTLLTVRVFDDGELVTEILPELWLLSRYSLHLPEPYSVRSDSDVAVVSRSAGGEDDERGGPAVR